MAKAKRKRRRKAKPATVILRHIPLAEIAIACDFIEELTNYADFTPDYPHQCVYLKCAGQGQAEAFASRMPHRHAFVPVPMRVGNPQPDASKAQLWVRHHDGGDSLRLIGRRVIAFRLEMLREALRFLLGNPKHPLKYMGSAWYSQTNWLLVDDQGSVA